MLNLGVSQKPIIMPTYPHFLPNDSDVWTRYLESPLQPIAEVWYDVHVGGMMEVPKNASDVESRVAAAVSRKRIDVIARVGNGYWVIEVKPYASMVALGQVLTYFALFTKEYFVPGSVWPVIIADAADEDLASEFDSLGVAVIVNDVEV